MAEECFAVVSNSLHSAGNHEAEKIDMEVTRGEREKGDERSIPVGAITIVFGSVNHLHPAQFQFVQWECEEQRIEPCGLGELEVG